MNNSKRIALISDIHGNVPALSAVLSDIENNSVDSIICLGDVATLGPAPSETVKMIKDLDCHCIMGNHEEVLFFPERADEFKIRGKMLQDTIYWCLEKLDSEDMSFLNEFKPSLSVHLGVGASMLCYHGSPNSSIDSVLPNTPNDDLEQIIETDNTIKIAVGGHTHSQMFKKYKETIIINPGSVGFAFVNPSFTPSAPSLSPVAEYAIVEYSKGKISVDLKSIGYKFEDFKLMVKNSDIPSKEWWIGEFDRIAQALLPDNPKDRTSHLCLS